MIATIFNAEEQRIVAALAKTDPSSNEYDDILVRYENLCRCALRGIDTEERIHYYLQDIAVSAAEMTNPATITPIPVAANPEPEEEKPEPVAEPEPTPVPTEEAEPAVEFEELKTRFLAAARSGVQVGDIIAAAGYKRLSDVPSNEYGRLLRMLSEA